MVLAEKLNVPAYSYRTQENGKTEKNITEAKQLEVAFTIPQNSFQTPGQKTICVSTSPEGTLLGAVASASRGSSLQCTARKTIRKYAGEEIGG